MLKNELKTDIQEMRNDVSDRIITLENENSRFRQINEELLLREKKIDIIVEKHDRELRKNNVIINGLTDEPICLKNVNAFLFSKFGIDEAAIEAHIIREVKNKLHTKLVSPPIKTQVMSNKNINLKDTNVFIQNGMPDKEQHIAYQARVFAREKRNNGIRAKAVRKKVYINGHIYTWHENCETFIQTPSCKEKNNMSTQKEDINSKKNQPANLSSDANISPPVNSKNSKYSTPFQSSSMEI